MMTDHADHANFQNIFELYDFIEQNPKMTTEILDLAFPRIFTPDGYDLCQVIAKAAGFNPKITEEYIKRYYLEFPKCWPKYDKPPFCDCFISNNFETALKTLENIPSNSREDIQFKIQFYRCILQKCETEIKSVHPLIQKIAEHLTNEAQSLPYVSIQFKDTKKECITNLLEKSLQLIEQIEDRIHIKDFDYVQLNHTLDTYPHLKKYAKQLIDKCQRMKHYSSVLWLLDLGNAEKNVYNREIPQKPHDILYKKCLLEILNKGIKLYESLPNQKSTTINRKEKDLKSKLENENEIWDLISELIVLLRISDSCKGSQTLMKDRQLGQKKNEATFIDIEIHLSQREILLEITSPRMQKNVLFQNAGCLTNHYASVMGGKREQLKTGLKKGSAVIDNFSEPYYVVIDTTKTPFGYSCQDIFEYSVGGIDLVSGVILLKWKCLSKDSHSYIQITGRIEPNPKAKNLLSDSEIAELKQIFNGESEV